MSNKKMGPNTTTVHPLHPEIATQKSSNSNNNNNESHKIGEGVEKKQYKIEIVWKYVILMVLTHIGFIYGFYLLVFVAKWSTGIYAVSLSILSTSLGITGGVHRLWSHRAYKANLPLKILLMIAQTMCFQNHIYHWARDHRVHHKYTDTDSDPHNSKRGFFFSHMGWLMIKKHKDVIAKGKMIDLRDLDADPVVQFQKKYYFILLPIISVILPVLIPIYYFGEDPWNSFFIAAIVRWVLSSHSIAFINSAAHMWGTRPYDKSIGPTESLFVAHVAFGEGWHNYHHVFPWDYKAAELGDYGVNLTLMFINFFAKIGWAYDLKTVSKEMIEKRIQRSGDGSHAVIKKSDGGDQHNHAYLPWGWGDTDMKEEDIQDIKTYNKLTEW